ASATRMVRRARNLHGRRPLRCRHRGGDVAFLAALRKSTRPYAGTGTRRHRWSAAPGQSRTPGTCMEHGAPAQELVDFAWLSWATAVRRGRSRLPATAVRPAAMA